MNLTSAVGKKPRHLFCCVHNTEIFLICVFNMESFCRLCVCLSVADLTKLSAVQTINVTGATPST